MLIEIINKILILTFFLSLLNVMRHLYYFLQALFKSTSEETVRYKLLPKSLFILGLSIAYILTIIWTGTKV